MWSGAAALLAAAAAAVAAAEHHQARASCSGSGLADESCLVQVSGQPARPEAPADASVDFMRNTRTSEDGMICDGPIVDSAKPSPNWQPNFMQCKAWQKRAVEAGCHGDACEVVFVGDSIFERLGGTACYLALPRANVLKMNQVFNQTFAYAARALFLAGAGDTTPQTLYMLDEVLPVLPSPKVFFVMVGTNNLGTCCTSAAEAARGVKAVVGRLQWQHPSSRILLHPLLNRAGMGCCGYPMQPLVDDVNKELKVFAEGLGEQVQWADCSQVFPRGFSEEVRALMPDKLHPSAKGYEEWMHCLNPLFHDVLHSRS